MAQERAKEEFEDIKENPLTDIRCGIALINEDDFLHWEGMIQGPEDTPYRGAFLYFTIDFTNNYPEEAPEFRFTNKNMYHLNVNSFNGHVCISILNNWDKNTKIRQIIYAIFLILYKQNPKSSYDKDKAKLYKENREEFNNNVIKWVKENALTIK